MELTRISLNLANAGVRRDIADPYEMHSTLARAFSVGPDAKAEPFLWRLEDMGRDGVPIVLVQSETGGRWEQFTEGVAGWVAALETKFWDPQKLRVGQGLVFRIRCNPTVTRNGKRQGLWDEPSQREWFNRQAEKVGLADVQVLRVTSGRLSGKRRKGEAGVVVCASQFDGVAKVAASEPLHHAVRHGIGHAKMMGLGLFSLAPFPA